MGSALARTLHGFNEVAGEPESTCSLRYHGGRGEGSARSDQGGDSEERRDHKKLEGRCGVTARVPRVPGGFPQWAREKRQIVKNEWLKTWILGRGLPSRGSRGLRARNVKANPTLFL